jgi:hypothetical protein
MKYIELTQGKQAIIDDADFNLLSRYKWGFNSRYARNSNFQSMQSFLIDNPNGLEIDHINRNTLDNRRSSLRLCSRNENLANREKFKNNKSGYKGVSWNKQYQKWCTQAQFKGKRLIAYFDDVLEAARAYNEFAGQLHQEFAVLNKLGEN